VKTVRLGGTGLSVSRLCLGMMSYGDPGWRPWILDEERAREHVRAAADAGITFYDTADVYSVGVSEIVTGRLLREVFDRREDYVLATKVRHPMGDGPNDHGLSRGHILDGVDASLRRLGVDHIDLYQIHGWDPEAPVEETMQALHDVVRAGKARYLGASNLRAWQLAKMQHAAIVNGWTPFVSMQNHYNLLHREDESELLPMLADQALASIPYSPLARGLLARAGTGQETSGHRYETDDSALQRYGSPDQRVLQSLAAVAASRGLAPATIALAWLLAQPVVTAPIIGVTRTEHLGDAVASLDIELSSDELEALGAAGRD
jgi:1-deoxyxylulose-5-phosphate synthase